MENFLLLIPSYRFSFSNDIETLTVDHKITTSLKKRNEFVPGMSIVAIADYFGTSKSRIRPHESRIQQVIKYLEADQAHKDRTIQKLKDECPKSLFYVQMLHDDNLNTWADLEAIRYADSACVQKLQKQIHDMLLVKSEKTVLFL